MIKFFRINYTIAYNYRQWPISSIQDKSEKSLEYIRNYLLQNESFWPIFLEDQEIKLGYDGLCEKYLTKFFSISF